jgi:magnesium transporter
MTSQIRRHLKKYGMSPGSLVHAGELGTEKVHVHLIEYNQDSIRKKENVSTEECLISMDKPEITWINITGVHDISIVEKIGRHLNLHALVLEDILHTGLRSKFDNYKNNLYIILRELSYDNQRNSIKDKQVSLILGKNYVLSFLEDETDIFYPILERIKAKNSRLRRRGADYLCYALVDCIVDHYFLTLSKIDDRLEKLESVVINKPNRSTLKELQALKKQIIMLRRTIWPTREVVSQFQRVESPLIHQTTKLYVQDVYDHVIQAMDTIESFRDITAGLHDIYMSNISYKMNEVIKILTVVATIFVPLMFITSLYGMNFKYMPELDWEWGYYFVWGLMIFVTGIMIAYFKKKNWF